MARHDGPASGPKPQDAMRPIRFFFDFVSPYAYLAWTQLGPLAARFDREVVPVPVLFAALLNENGQKGPAEIPRKKLYMMKDCMRTAARLGVPFGPPPSHPFNPLLALRVASLPMANATRRALVDGLFQDAWGGSGRGVTAVGIVTQVAMAAGLSGLRAVEDAKGAEAKERVKKQTEEALALGVFGVPTAEINGELFWGLDALANLELYLDGKDGLDHDLFEHWAALPASATR
jgi:2-hydroxychromene-2-carboxylate isomerase